MMCRPAIVILYGCLALFLAGLLAVDTSLVAALEFPCDQVGRAVGMPSPPLNESDVRWAVTTINVSAGSVFRLAGCQLTTPVTLQFVHLGSLPPASSSFSSSSATLVDLDGLIVTQSGTIWLRAVDNGGTTNATGTNAVVANVHIVLRNSLVNITMSADETRQFNESEESGTAVVDFMSWTNPSSIAQYRLDVIDSNITVVTTGNSSHITDAAFELAVFCIQSDASSSGTAVMHTNVHDVVMSVTRSRIQIQSNTTASSTGAPVVLSNGKREGGVCVLAIAVVNDGFGVADVTIVALESNIVATSLLGIAVSMSIVLPNPDPSNLPIESVVGDDEVPFRGAARIVISALRSRIAVRSARSLAVALAIVNAASIDVVALSSQYSVIDAFGGYGVSVLSLMCLSIAPSDSWTANTTSMTPAANRSVSSLRRYAFNQSRVSILIRASQITCSGRDAVAAGSLLYVVDGESTSAAASSAVVYDVADVVMAIINSEVQTASSGNIAVSGGVVARSAGGWVRMSRMSLSIGNATRLTSSGNKLVCSAGFTFSYPVVVASATSISMPLISRIDGFDMLVHAGATVKAAGQSLVNAAGILIAGYAASLQIVNMTTLFESARIESTTGGSGTGGCASGGIAVSTNISNMTLSVWNATWIAVKSNVSSVGGPAVTALGVVATTTTNLGPNTVTMSNVIFAATASSIMRCVGSVTVSSLGMAMTAGQSRVDVTLHGLLLLVANRSYLDVVGSGSTTTVGIVADATGGLHFDVDDVKFVAQTRATLSTSCSRGRVSSSVGFSFPASTGSLFTSVAVIVTDATVTLSDCILYCYVMSFDCGTASSRSPLMSLFVCGSSISAPKSAIGPSSSGSVNFGVVIIDSNLSDALSCFSVSPQISDTTTPPLPSQKVVLAFVRMQLCLAAGWKKPTAGLACNAFVNAAPVSNPPDTSFPFPGTTFLTRVENVSAYFYSDHLLTLTDVRPGRVMCPYFSTLDSMLTTQLETWKQRLVARDALPTTRSTSVTRSTTRSMSIRIAAPEAVSTLVLDSTSSVDGGPTAPGAASPTTASAASEGRVTTPSADSTSTINTMTNDVAATPSQSTTAAAVSSAVNVTMAVSATPISPEPIRNVTAVNVTPTTTATTTMTAATPGGIELSARQQRSVVTAYAIVSSVTAMSAFTAPSDAQQIARLFSAMRFLRCRGGGVVDGRGSSLRLNSTAVVAEADKAEEDGVAEMTFPRSLLPMLRVQGSQRQGAIVANVAAICIAIVVSGLVFARSERAADLGGARRVVSNGETAVNAPLLAAGTESQCRRSEGPNVVGNDGAAVHGHRLSDDERPPAAADGGSRRDERMAAARFPSTVIAVSLVVLDGTVFASMSTAFESGGSAPAMGGRNESLSWMLAAVGILISLLVVVKCVHVVIACPLQWIVLDLGGQDTPGVIAVSRLRLAYWIDLLLRRRGYWDERPSVETNHGGISSAPHAAIRDTELVGILQPPSAVVVSPSAADCPVARPPLSITAGFNTTVNEAVTASESTLPPGSSPSTLTTTTTTSLPHRYSRPIPYLGMFRCVIASTRGGVGLPAACARYAIPIEATLTVITAVVEAASTTRCLQYLAAHINLAVATVGFLYVVITAPHPSPVKAVFTAVLGALNATASLFVTLALRGHDAASSTTNAAASMSGAVDDWIDAALKTTLVASAIGVASTATSLVAWWLKKRQKRLNRIAVGCRRTDHAEPPGCRGTNDEVGTVVLNSAASMLTTAPLQTHLTSPTVVVTAPAPRGGLGTEAAATAGSSPSPVGQQLRHRNPLNR